MDKVLVTGGGGFIGKALVRELLERGHSVAVLGRSTYPDLHRWGVECFQGDIRDPEIMEQATAGRDTVFHVAALAGIWGKKETYYSINVQGTAQVLAACKLQQVPYLVYTSTPSVVFDRQSLNGVDESAPYAKRPLCHYAASKIQAERLVLQANSSALHTLAIRPHLVWGPGDQQLIPRLLARGRVRQLRMVGDGQNLVDIAFIDNVVHAHLLAAEHLHAGGEGAGLPFFIGQAEPVNLWQWINNLFQQLDIPAVTSHLPFSLAYGIGGLLEGGYALCRCQHEPKMTRFLAYQLAHSHWFSHARAEQLLGYRPLVSTTQGMEQLVHWLQDQDALAA